MGGCQPKPKDQSLKKILVQQPDPKQIEAQMN
jgi:hypothetical protein